MWFSMSRDDGAPSTVTFVNYKCIVDSLDRPSGKIFYLRFFFASLILSNLFVNIRNIFKANKNMR